MDKASAITEFKSGWEQRTGPSSEFDQKLTPEGRTFKHILNEIPCSATETLFNGISVKITETKPPESVKPKKMNWLPAASAGIAAALTCVICLLTKCTLITTSILATVVVFLTTFFAINYRFRKEKKEQPRQPVFHADLDIDSAAVEKALDMFHTGLDSVINYVLQKEEDAKLGFDITDSRSFGEWVQKFADYSNRHEENSDLLVLKGELVSKLLTMGIEVYDSLRKDPNTGELKLPDQAWFRDERAEDNAEFSVVNHAVVSSRRGVLAVGEIK